MDAMSHISDVFLACSSKVKILKPPLYLTIWYPLTVTQIVLRRVQFPTVMSDTQSLNTSLLGVMICSKTECSFIRELRDRTLQIIFNVWWTSMNVGAMWPVAWNNIRHAPSWRFYLHCGIEETGRRSIICIICHQVLRHPSEHGTSSMGKHLPVKAQIGKLHKSTVSEVTKSTTSTVDETTFAILKRERSQGILIISSQRKIKLTIQVSSILTELTDKTL